MTSQVLGRNDDSQGLEWEDILSIIAVLTLAGVFIKYQAFPSSTESLNVAEPPVVVHETLLTPAPIVTDVSTAKQTVWVSPEEAPTSKTQASIAQTPIAKETTIAAIEPMQAEPTALVAEKLIIEKTVIEATIAEPVIAEVVETPAAPSTESAFEMVRNIQTNFIEFAGKVAPNSQVRLLIEGEASEILQANEIGVWSYTQKLEPGFYTFAVQTLDNQQAVSSSSKPATYQIFPINQSATD